jgi:hypothetical protein
VPPTTLVEWIARQQQAAAVRRRWVRIATALFVAALVASIVLVWRLAPDALPELLEYEGVALAGGLVGLAELVSRYRDQPLSAVTSLPGLGYMAINALASLAALILIFTFDWQFGVSGDAVLVTQLLVASFGAMALFRTSLFTIRAGDSDVGIGPSSLLSIILEACDQGVDRVRARARAWEVARVMNDVSFDASNDALPAVAIGLMQNLSASNQAALSVEISTLRQATGLSPQSKSLLLGLAIADQVGPHVLEAAKLTLGDQIVTSAGFTAEASEADLTALAEALSTEAPGQEETDQPTAAELLARVEAANGDESPSRAAGLPQTPQTP